jgi:PAS domain S-box-containing protein
MSSPTNELQDWYLAYLRKNAQSAPGARDLTPMALVKADSELLKQHIEENSGAEAGANKEASAFKEKWQAYRGQPSYDRAAADSLEKASVFIQPFPLWLGTSITLGLASFPLLCMSAATNFFLPILVLTSLSFLLILVLLKTVQSKSRLESRIIEKFSEHGSVLQGSGTGDLDCRRANIEESLDRLLKMLELTRQKESLIFDFCPYLLCKTNSQRKILALNSNASKIWGYGNSELMGLPLEELLSGKSRQNLLASLARCQKDSAPEELEISLTGKDGQTRDLHWRTEWSASAEAYFCIGEDISARKENERLKEELAAMITHDLRAPISALSFWADNMLSGTYGEVSQKTASSLRRTQRNLKGVLSLLDNLLDLDKLEAGSFKSVPGKLPLQDCFKQASDLLSDWTAELEIEFEIEYTELVVLADQGLLNRILLNFCSNAVKWSPRGAKILLRSRKEGSYAVVEIEDHGPGVPAELQDSLFQRWSTSGAAPRKSSAGAGLGLYIARRFAELQGGSVGMRNSEPGGSIFWVSLPLASPDPDI